MPFKTRNLLTAACFSITLGISLFYSQGSRSQPESNFKVAVSYNKNHHHHLLPLRSEDLPIYISLLSQESDSITLQSSYSYAQGMGQGELHSHEVKLSKAHLTQLRNTGALTLESESSANHRHVFKFISKSVCPAIFNFS